MSFSPDHAIGFRFTGRDYEPTTGTARFGFTLEMAGERKDIPFVETLQFVDAPPVSDGGRRSALARCLKYLHLALGVSYYKAAIPPRITVEGEPLPEDVARFFDKLYWHGLGEFSYVNRVDLTDRIRFPSDASARDPLPAFSPSAGVLTPIGGGKDSLVSIELLRAAGVDFSTFYMGDSALIDEMSASLGVPRVRVRRRISPALFELNRQGALNGHVPISAIIAFVALTAAVIHGFDHIVLSNERSANIPNTEYLGRAINHQYSKSLEFEEDFSRLTAAHVSPDIHYFSLLRGFSELKIASLFSRHEQHHPHFGSCNRGFRIHEPKSGSRWCNDCPKCRFVFLSLAPFMDKSSLVAIFGKNLLDEASQFAGYRELAGAEGFKPFECVGDVNESRAALYLIADKPEWRDDRVVRWFNERVRPGWQTPENAVAAEMAFSDRHRIPEPFLSIVREA